MKHPFYIVRLDGDDISKHISKFTFEDCLDESNFLKIVIDGKSAEELQDDPRLVKGTTLTFSFGFVGGLISETHKAKITNVEYTYSSAILIVLKCLDKGIDMSKAHSKKIWKGMTSSQIAKEIATKHGLKFVTDETKKVWRSMPQSAKSDFRFLHYLSRREGGGDYIFYIRNGTLYYIRSAISSRSFYLFTWGDNMISFRPKEKEAEKPAEGTKSVFKNKEKEQEVDSVTEEPTGTTDGYKIVQVGTEFTKKFFSDPTEDTEEAKGAANNKKKKSEIDAVSSELITEGLPFMVTNKIITVANVVKKYSGNWYAVKVVHTIDTSGYITRIMSNKNGFREATNLKAKDPNTSTGTKEDKDFVEIKQIFEGAFEDASSGELISTGG